MFLQQNIQRKHHDECVTLYLRMTIFFSNKNINPQMNRLVNCLINPAQYFTSF